jgi:uracil-DNA glycosylase family 4
VSAPPLAELNDRLIECRRCPRLVAWREQVASERRRAFATEEYWGRPVPGFGDPDARILIVGLAPAAHGGNRTGRVFTGDRSGDFIFGALHRAGLANQPTSHHREDGLRLNDVYITAVVRCAPPGNRPDPSEQAECRPWLLAEWRLLPRVRVVVALGQLAYNGVLLSLAALGADLPSPRPRFAHGARINLGADTPLVLSCYHPSQQNTFTGKLTAEMVDAVFHRARAELRLSD